MKASTPPSVLSIRLRAWLLAVIVLTLVTHVASAGPFYSNTGPAGANVTISSGCTACGVTDARKASNTGLSDDYAIIYKVVSVGSSVGLRLKLNGTGQAGARAGVIVAPSPSLINASLLGVYTINTYLSSNNGQSGPVVESRVVSAGVIQSLFGGGRPSQLEFIASQPFNEVEIVVSGAVDALYALRVYYAYSVPSLIRPTVNGLVSRFPGSGSALDPYYSSGVNNVGIVSACALAGVTNPRNAVDSDLTNHASFNCAVCVSCPASLAVQLEGTRPAPAGFYAGFVIGNSGLLDLSVLSGLEISTYLNGVLQETRSGANLLEIRLLPDGKAQVSFPSTLPFNQVQIKSLGLLSVLNNLDIYYGFGVEPNAFEPTTVVRSDFSNPPPSSSYEVSGNSLVCLTLGTGCAVTDARNAADNDLTNYASINTTIDVATVKELKLTLNGTPTTANDGNVAPAGNRAGVVVQLGAGLLDASALSQITISTYDAENNLLESASGSAALSLNLLPSGKQEVSFLTTQPFSRVQISVAALANIGTNIKIYQAFADDRTGGIPTLIVPLPVELTAFTGKWNNGATDLSWATASEKNSSYFVVERSKGSEAGFQAVGQVMAAGTSTSTKKYSLRDAEAGAQGVAILYYRLRQVDNDGKEAYSPLVSVAVGKQLATPQLAVYPNPAPDAQTVTVQCLNLPATGATISTYSEMGQLVSRLVVAEASSQLALPALAPGLYHVVLRDAIGKQLGTQRLIVGGN